MNYPYIIIGLYISLNSYFKDFDKNHFNNPFEISKYSFKPAKKVVLENTKIDSTFLFTSKELKKISFQELDYNAKYKIKYLIVPKGYRISILPSVEKPNSFESIVKTITEEGYFLMNAGMFHANYNSVGLSISEGKLIQAIDSTKTPQNGNFYMYPNGVFAIKNDFSAVLTSTDEFLKTNPKYSELNTATQSGPMLLLNNKIHPLFSPDSKNLNIRNGVGITKNEDLIFAISETEINFYDFASFFKEHVKCTSALYLDGAISEIYYRDKDKVSHTPRVSSGKFGPVFLIKLDQKK